jgi:hypothetical protein
MSDAGKAALLRAITDYNYPPVTYDFAQQCEIRFPAIRKLDDHLCGLLHSGDETAIMDGISGILYWGHYRAPGVRDCRIKRFRAKVTRGQLEECVRAFEVLNGTSLDRLRDLRLPEFRNMAFVSKLRTFLDPERYCVLDRKISSLAQFRKRLKIQPTYIPITASNERVYASWVNTCAFIASGLHTATPIRPVDVERGIFRLIDQGERAFAEQCFDSCCPENP